MPSHSAYFVLTPYGLKTDVKSSFGIFGQCLVLFAVDFAKAYFDFGAGFHVDNTTVFEVDNTIGCGEHFMVVGCCDDCHTKIFLEALKQGYSLFLLILHQGYVGYIPLGLLLAEILQLIFSPVS